MADERIRESRRRVEERLDEVREAVRREVGVVPRTLGYVLPLAALSVGLLLASRLVGRRRIGD